MGVLSKESKESKGEFISKLRVTIETMIDSMTETMIDSMKETKTGTTDLKEELDGEHLLSI